MAPAPRFSLDEEEVRVLDAAAQCVTETSLLDFRMSAIAKVAGISMGSVYKHVRSKDDVLVGLACRGAENVLKTIRLIMTLPLSAPERLIACLLIDPLKIQAEPYETHLEMLISNQALLNKASTRWLQKLASIDQAIQAVFAQGLINEPELQVDQAQRAKVVEELMVGIWSLHVGFKLVSLHRNAISLENQVIPLPFPLAAQHSLIRNAALLLNAYEWQYPLTYDGIEKTIAALVSLGFRD